MNMPVRKAEPRVPVPRSRRRRRRAHQRAQAESFVARRVLHGAVRLAAGVLPPLVMLARC